MPYNTSCHNITNKFNVFVAYVYVNESDLCSRVRRFRDCTTVQGVSRKSVFSCSLLHREEINLERMFPSNHDVKLHFTSPGTHFLMELRRVPWFMYNQNFLQRYRLFTQHKYHSGISGRAYIFILMCSNGIRKTANWYMSFQYGKACFTNLWSCNPIHVCINGYCIQVIIYKIYINI